MNRWEIYWANAPFEDQPQLSKSRPVIICVDKKVYALVIKVTSHDKRDHSPFDYSLVYWKECGLACESVVRVDKLSQLPPSAFGDYIGKLHPADIIEIQKLMKQYSQRYSCK